MMIRLWGCIATVMLLSSSLQAGGWKLFWSDEFDSTALNEQNWMVRVAPARWVNNEEQRYTAGHDQASSNIFVKNGHLILEARKSASGEITSGRIEGMGKKSFQYGRMESRLRMPKSQGYWPAFWMLGTNGGWPSCGEIDIMEGKGAQPRWTQGAFHSAQGLNIANRSYTVPATQGDLHDSFHIHAIEWSADSIRWYCDNQNFLTLLRSARAGIPINTWPYYFILNCAVGGGFGGASNSTTVFPESLVVDYVRVYKWDPTLKTEAISTSRAVRQPIIAKSGAAYTITLPSAQEYSVELASINGRTALAQKGLGRTSRIKTEGLATGVYFVTVKGAFGALKERIVVR
jgi:beta-glucanase (GH16 family)